MIDGLLLDWVDMKAREPYVEPKREGTPRGTPIGFSYKKHLSAILAITRMKVMKQSELLGVPYGVLRKWRTEAEFKEKAKDHAKEFESYLLKRRYRAEVKD